MKILAMLEMEGEVLNTLLGDNVAYRPDLAKKGDSFLVSYIKNNMPEIIISKNELSPGVLRAWRSACRGVDLYLLLVSGNKTKTQVKVVDGLNVVDLAVHSDSGVEAFNHAERIYTKNVTCKRSGAIVERIAQKRKKSDSVLLVGAGIVNLIAAHYLSDKGYQVTVVEASHDPRNRGDWESLGCTHGGENARMFTLTECDDYHDKSYESGSEFNGHFHKNIRNSGWVIGEIESFGEGEFRWIEEFKNVPIWLANLYNEDIFDLNREARLLWEQLIAELPELFENVEFKRNVLRVVSDEGYQRHQIKRQEHVGSTVRVLDHQGIIDEYPSLAAGCANGTIVGGIEVLGFTLNVHKFVGNLIGRLERSGVIFKWNLAACGIDRDVHGVVTSITAGDQKLTADNYVISPGVYGNCLLQGTSSDNKVHGMLGAWISFPNLEPKLHQSVKISRPGHVANSGNIILAKDEKGNDILIFGSGFGYTGSNSTNISAPDLECIYRSMEDYVMKTFPQAYETARDSGQLMQSRKYCIRPWTATCLGVFEIESAVSGCLIITSGHNTGGFTQSTSSAMAVIAAIEGEEHPMHSLYHPERFTSFYYDSPRSRNKPVCAETEENSPRQERQGEYAWLQTT